MLGLYRKDLGWEAMEKEEMEVVRGERGVRFGECYGDVVRDLENNGGFWLEFDRLYRVSTGNISYIQMNKEYFVWLNKNEYERCIFEFLSGTMFFYKCLIY